MKKRPMLLTLLVVAVAASTALPASAAEIAFKLLPTYSRATYKSDAPLETIVGTTAGPGVTGSLALDPARPQGAKGTVKVDLTTLNSGVPKRDEDARSPQYLDTANEANRHAVFELKSVDITGPLDPGKEMPAKVRGILTIKGKPVETEAKARVTYIKLTPEQVEGQKRFGFTTDNVKVRATFTTSFTNHGMQIPQLLFLKVSNEIQLETDLTFVRQ
ncbi:MAG: YceI family protein [Candidatus Rokubacteria bacterium]|nr:YceI family protein [Candidatus Rokubacteria bacterium]